MAITTIPERRPVRVPAREPIIRKEPETEPITPKHPIYPKRIEPKKEGK